MDLQLRRVRQWLFGTEPGARIRVVGEAVPREGLTVGIALEGRLDDLACDLVVSDRFGPALLRDLVEFVGRRRLPVDRWVLRGVGGLPFRCETAARWIAGLARAASGGIVAVEIDDLRADAARRLVAHLRRLHDSVDLAAHATAPDRARGS